jgi:Spy/CpxP family protein refolding chaperone
MKLLRTEGWRLKIDKTSGRRNQKIVWKRRKDRIMKAMVRFIISSFVFLALATQPSHAGTAPSSGEIKNTFQEPSRMMMPPPAAPHGAERMDGEHRPCLPYFQNLDLGSDQKDALKEIENATRKEMIRKRAERQIAEIEIQELLDKESVDLKAVELKLKQIAGIESELQLTVIRSMEKMKASLTPEQRNGLKQERQIHPGQRPYRQREPLCDHGHLPPPFVEQETGDWGLECPLLSGQGHEYQEDFCSSPQGR